MMSEPEPGRFDAGFDYTSVQVEPCPYCTQNVASIPPADLAAALVEAGRRWRDFVGAVMDYPGGVDALRARPQPDVWAAVEYGCHVRDGLSLFARYVELTLLVERPQFDPWDHESAARNDHYREQDPMAVADDIGMATRELASLLQPRTRAALERTGMLGEVEFTTAGLARYALHEALHHLRDATAVVPAVTI